MASRITINGKIQWSSRDWRNPTLGRQSEALTLDQVYPQPPPSDIPPRVGAPFTDPDDGVTYRVVANINPLDGWCLAEQLTKHYNIPYKVLMHWARIGLVDALMEHGSPVKRYRPRDGAKCKALAAEWNKGDKNVKTKR